VKTQRQTNSLTGRAMEAGETYRLGRMRYRQRRQRSEMDDCQLQGIVNSDDARKVPVPKEF
jgi:hypothetical protein